MLEQKNQNSVYVSTVQWKKTNLCSGDSYEIFVVFDSGRPIFGIFLLIHSDSFLLKWVLLPSCNFNGLVLGLFT